MKEVWSALIAAVAAIVVALITTRGLTSEIRKDVAKLEALPVGTVIASFLNETQLNDSGEGLWVLADGRRVVGSDYARITGQQEVPNLQGMFLRGLDPKGSTDPDGTTRSLGSVQLDALQVHAHEERAMLLGGGYYAHSDAPTSQPGHGSPGDNYKGFMSGEPVQSSQDRPKVRTSTETRPVNVSVWYYIKVKYRK